MTKSTGLGVYGISVGLLLGCASAPPTDGAEADEDFATISQALTGAEVLGFEGATGWVATAGTLASSSDRVEGSTSLAMSNVGYTLLTSAAIESVPGLVATGSISVKLPTNQPNPWWLGQVDLRVESPSRAVYNELISHFELTGRPLGSWQELSFTLSPPLLSALASSGAADIRFKLEVNVPFGSQTYRFDALRFSGGTNECQYHVALGDNAKKVHVVYLVPSDKTTQPAYVEGLERGAKHLQAWWKKQMGNGKTFSLASPAVKVFRTTHDSAWYNHAPGAESTLDYYYNMMADATALAGAYPGDPDNVWLVYLDAQPRCGSITGALATYAGFPANDLRGLAGLSTIPVCPNEAPELPKTCRWVGGMGHELGHAVGLPHPASCEPTTTPSCPSQAIMWGGYLTYPAATFTPSDLTTLNASPFIATEPTIPTTSCDCADL